MLTVHVVRAEGVGYHLTGLAPGRQPVAGESPGRWEGRGSAVLGLRGEVAAPELAGVLAGTDPVDGRALRGRHGVRQVCGFDLVFAAPKEVSVLHLLAPRELGAAAGAAHVAAVADAVGYLEREGLGVRRSRDGVVSHLATTGAVAAGFVHRTSRALDPHLHSHVVTANVAQGVDGRWSALDSRRLFLHRDATRAVYESSLRHHLDRSTGLVWRRAPGGWEAPGVDPVTCRVFSARAASIDEAAFRATGGRGSSSARRVAFFADRPAKDRAVTMGELRDRWARRAAVVGVDLSQLVRVVGPPAREGARHPGAGHVEEALDRALAGRTQVDARDLVAVVADAVPHGLVAADTVRVVDALARATGAGRGEPVSGRGPLAVDAVRGALRGDPDLVQRTLGGAAREGAAPSASASRVASRDRRAADHRLVVGGTGPAGLTR